MNTPMVSCIMPTANREKYIPFAINYFLQQDYPNKELVIIDDGKKSIASLIPSDPRIRYLYTEPIGSIGLKRNLACERSRGEIIVHWDDDDWHAEDWLSAEVYFLQESGADICGLQHTHFYSPITNKLLTVYRQYSDAPNPMNWVHGATLAYWKSFWEKHPFKDLYAGEDDDFIQNNGARLFIHDYRDGFICMLHPHNTIIRNFEDRRHKKRLG
ncbi:glycosyltransferase family A protein [Pedobacter sp. L105]|uniref:glycosyltransferase family 2 protein n=1 Tax=Pedobacter sp. L105 TaxID=1641871 RepID=UPI00131AAB39|nr:glycosyltransferase family A protein [Pedobacter sp. L105]